MAAKVDVSSLIRTIEIRDNLSQVERDAVGSLPFTRRTFGNGEEIVREGARATQSCLLITGFACRAKIMASGELQLTAVHTPGDFVDLHAFTLKVMDHSVVALGACEVAFVTHVELLRVTSEHPHLTRLLWLLTTIDAAVQRSWTVSAGRQPPARALAHLVCEIYTKLEVSDLIKAKSFSFPATQSNLADMLGLSTVHLNRSLQTLRRTGLLTWTAFTVSVPDLAALAEYAEFDPLYLNMWNEPR